MAGPSTTTRFSSPEKMELAATSSFSPTTSGVRAPAAGRYGTSTAADSATRTRTMPTGARTATTTAKALMMAALASDETMRTVTR